MYGKLKSILPKRNGKLHFTPKNLVNRMQFPSLMEKSLIQSTLSNILVVKLSSKVHQEISFRRRTWRSPHFSLSFDARAEFLKRTKFRIANFHHVLRRYHRNDFQIVQNKCLRDVYDAWSRP